jgi:hypothetical protein
MYFKALAVLRLNDHIVGPVAVVPFIGVGNGSLAFGIMWDLCPKGKIDRAWDNRQISFVVRRDGKAVVKRCALGGGAILEWINDGHWYFAFRACKPRQLKAGSKRSSSIS